MRVCVCVCVCCVCVCAHVGIGDSCVDRLHGEICSDRIIHCRIIRLLELEKGRNENASRTNPRNHQALLKQTQLLKQLMDPSRFTIVPFFRLPFLLCGVFTQSFRETVALLMCYGFRLASV